MWLRFEKVSRQRKDLQDDSRWPAPCMPHGFGSSRQTWTILKSGPAWLLLLIEQTPSVEITYAD